MSCGIVKKKKPHILYASLLLPKIINIPAVKHTPIPFFVVVM